MLLAADAKGVVPPVFKSLLIRGQLFMLLRSLIEGVGLGLSLSLTCAATCGPIYFSFMLQRQSSWAKSAIVFLKLTGARFIAYAAFGVAAGFAGRQIGGWNRTWFSVAAYILFSIFLIVSAFRTDKREKNCQISQWSKFADSPVILGLITGLNFCPSFLIATTEAVNISGPVPGAVLFVGFFLGSNLPLFLLPVFGALNNKKILHEIGMISAIAIGCWFITQALLIVAGQILRIDYTPGVFIELIHSERLSQALLAALLLGALLVGAAFCIVLIKKTGFLNKLKPVFSLGIMASILILFAGLGSFFFARADQEEIVNFIVFADFFLAIFFVVYLLRQSRVFSGPQLIKASVITSVVLSVAWLSCLSILLYQERQRQSHELEADLETKTVISFFDNTPAVILCKEEARCSTLQAKLKQNREGTISLASDKKDLLESGYVLVDPSWLDENNESAQALVAPNRFVILLPNADEAGNFDASYADRIIAFLDNHYFKLDKKYGSLFDMSNSPAIGD